MRTLIVSLLAATGLAAALGEQTFTGTITDSRCADADHSEMRMGPTDAECVVACVSAHSASYVLHDGKETYTLTLGDQQVPEKFAAQKVSVIGTLDAKAKTIKVESMTKVK